MQDKNQIDSLKTNRSPGNDCIPAEFNKACKTYLSPIITTVFNYKIDHRDFPEIWTSGIRSAVFKSVKRNIVDNFRGLTILPMMEKIFELVVYRRLAFVNEAFDCYDRYDNGFLEGNRTSDNLFISNALVEKQLVLNKYLHVSFIDFSKAFVMLIGQYCSINWSAVVGRVEWSILFGIFTVKHISVLNVREYLVLLLTANWVSTKVESQAD